MDILIGERESFAHLIREDNDANGTIDHVEKMKITPTISNMNSRWIKKVNLKSKSLKL